MFHPLSIILTPAYYLLLTGRSEQWNLAYCRYSPRRKTSELLCLLLEYPGVVGRDGVGYYQFIVWNWYDPARLVTIGDL